MQFFVLLEMPYDFSNMENRPIESIKKAQPAHRHAQFCAEQWPEIEFVHQAVAQILWGHTIVSVAYGTSQKTNRIYSGEFRIVKNEHAAYASAGLSYDTTFNLRHVFELPFNDAYFSVPPHAPHGQIPMLGALHPSMVRIAASAFAAASR